MGLKAQCDRCDTTFETSECSDLTLMALVDDAEAESLGMLCDDCVGELRAWLDDKPVRERAA